MIGNSELQERMAEQMEFALSQTPEALAAENAKLRGERDMYRYLVGCMVHPDIPDQLAVENRKLREQGARLFDKTLELGTENAKLRDSLKALIMGTNVELCADRDASQCQECSMAIDENRCVMSDAMLLLGIDMYGEPLRGEQEPTLNDVGAEVRDD